HSGKAGRALLRKKQTGPDQADSEDGEFLLGRHCLRVPLSVWPGPAASYPLGLWCAAEVPELYWLNARRAVHAVVVEEAVRFFVAHGRLAGFSVEVVSVIGVRLPAPVEDEAGFSGRRDEE